MVAELFTRTMGNGPERALALHCGLGQSGMWKGVALALGEQFTITAPDLPGHGRSAPFEKGDVHDQATDAVTPLGRDGMHLIGHSFGATVALRLAVEQRFKPASLTLIEPVFFAAARGRSTFDAHRAKEAALFETGCNEGALASARGFNSLWGGGTRWQDIPARVQKTMAQGMPFVFGTEPSLWQDSCGLLDAGKLEKVQCPVALIRGDATVPIIADVHAGLLDRLPNAHEVVITGAAHMLVMTHATQVADVIRTEYHPT